MRFRSLALLALFVARLLVACSRTSVPDESPVTGSPEPSAAASGAAGGSPASSSTTRPRDGDFAAFEQPISADPKASASDGSIGSISSVAAPKVIRHRFQAEFPERGVERAPRINEYNRGEGYLDIARSSDGSELWVRRHWDNGDTAVTRFSLESNGHAGLVLQFVDGVDAPAEVEIAGQATFKDSSGRKHVQALTAWPVDPVKGVAYDVEAQAWIPMMPAAGPPTASTRKRVQWMFKVDRCADASPCLYYGSPADVCGKYTANLPKAEDWMMWIAPANCKGQW